MWCKDCEVIMNLEQLERRVRVLEELHEGVIGDRPPKPSGDMVSLKEIESKFFKLLDEKPSWGKNQVKNLFIEATRQGELF